MATLNFYLPDQPSFKRKPAFLKTPQLTVATTGRVAFNGAAVEFLRLKPGQQVQLGNDQANPREWYITQQVGLGFQLAPIAQHPGLYFKSRPLRELILTSLPLAPTDSLLTFKLEELSVPLDEGDAWPLLTAPYWQPQVSTEEKLAQKRTLVSALPPGLLGIKAQALLYGH